MNERSDPRPLKVTLVDGPQFPLETLFYVWEQSRSNRSLPSVDKIHKALLAGQITGPASEWYVGEYGVGISVAQVLSMLGFPATAEGHGAFVRKFEDTINTIMAESIPVTENLHFVFHLENIPISLREQLVRHRIGNHVGPNVSFDIIPELAESTFWSQTSRVVPFGTFFNEGRYIVPASLSGKRVDDEYLHLGCCGEEVFDYDGVTVDAKQYYLDTLHLLQHRYQKLVEAGVHIEDARQIVPVGATHGITWGLNLKAMLHIFGKRASWIAQIGLWEEVIHQMTREMGEKVHPVFYDLGKPSCIKNGKYVGCPVNGTNVERVVGTDGMPPCPLWVRYQTAEAVAAFRATEAGKWKDKGRTEAAWQPPLAVDGFVTDGVAAKDIRNWKNDATVEREMLVGTAEKFSRLWHFPIFEGLPEGK
jgi:thymidylate synthase ThyX